MKHMHGLEKENIHSPDVCTSLGQAEASSLNHHPGGGDPSMEHSADASLGAH